MSLKSDAQPPSPDAIPGRATSWQLRTRRLALPPRPLLLGIVNVTPDSFSDGGRFLDAAAAIDQGLQLVADGADLLDVGGESTRPNATPVDVAEELRRVVPVVQALAERTSVPISIDTYKAAVAAEALAAGAEIINDVTALGADADMLPLAVDRGAGVIAMHMRGTPQTMQDDPTYADVVLEVRDFLRDRRDRLIAAGLDVERLALDPGIGFGKTHQHSITLLARCRELHALARPLVVGHSRKSFIAKIMRDKEVDRTPGTVGVAISLALQGVQILRVHDCCAVRQGLALFEWTGGLDGRPRSLDER